MTQFLRRVLLASTIFSSLVTSSDLEVRAPAACSSGIYAQLSVLAGDALVSAYCSAVAPVTCTTPAPKIKRAALSTTTTTTTKSSSSTSTTTRSSATATTNPIRTSTQTTSQATTVTKAITITTTTKPASTTTSGNVRLSAWSSFLAQACVVFTTSTTTKTSITTATVSTTITTTTTTTTSTSTTTAITTRTIATTVPTTTTSTTTSSTTTSLATTSSTGTTSSTTTSSPSSTTGSCASTVSDRCDGLATPACHRQDYPVGSTSNNGGCQGCLKRVAACDDGNTYCFSGYAWQGPVCQYDSDCWAWDQYDNNYVCAAGNYCVSNKAPYECFANPDPSPSTTTTTAASTSTTSDDSGSTTPIKRAVERAYPVKLVRAEEMGIVGKQWRYGEIILVG